MPVIPRPAIAPSAPRAFDVMNNLNLEREHDPGYRPNHATAVHIDDIASRIEMTTSGPIGYTLDGVKIDSHTARTFLDNTTRTDRLLSDPNLTTAGRGILEPHVQKAAVDNFAAYAQQERESLWIPAGLRMTASGTKKLGKLALRAAEPVIRGASATPSKLKAGVKKTGQLGADVAKGTGSKLREAAVVGVAYSWFAMERSAKAVNSFASRAANEYYDAETQAALKLAEQYLRLGAFATAVGSDLSEVRKTLDAMKDEDDRHEQYDPDNVRDVTRRATHRSLLRLAAARMAKDTLKQSISNRKA